MATDEWAMDATGCVVWLETEADYEYLRDVARDALPDSSEWE